MRERERDGQGTGKYLFKTMLACLAVHAIMNHVSDSMPQRELF